MLHAWGLGTLAPRPWQLAPCLAYVLPLQELAHQRGGRHRLARGVQYLSVVRREDHTEDHRHRDTRRASVSHHGRVAEAHHGSEQGRGVRGLWQDGPEGEPRAQPWAGCPRTGQGHVGSEPLLAGPRSAAGLAPLQGARPRGGRLRLARDVHDPGVDRSEGHGEAHSHRAPRWQTPLSGSASAPAGTAAHRCTARLTKPTSWPSPRPSATTAAVRAPMARCKGREAPGRHCRRGPAHRGQCPASLWSRLQVAGVRL